MNNAIDFLKEQLCKNNPSMQNGELENLISGVSEPMAQQFSLLLDEGFDILKATEFHKKNTPQISYLNYVKDKCDALSADVKKRKVAYLDTKYWVNIRKSIMQKEDNAYRHLYELLKQKGSEKKVICPLSTESISELFHQSDINTLNATIDVMDSLSDGVAYKFFFDKITDDFTNYFIKTTNIHLKRMSDFIPVCAVLGIAQIWQLSSIADDSMQKALFDMIRTMRFKYFGKFPGVIDSSDEKSENGSIAEKLNLEKERNPIQSTKEAAFKIFCSNLKVFKNEIEKAINNSCFLEKNISLRDAMSRAVHLADEKELDSIVNGIAYRFYNEELDKDDIPLLSINSLLSGTVYTEQKRKFKANDFDDFRHAAIALPSSDYFFTEDSLAHLLNNTTMLSHKYNVKVVSKVEEAVKILETLQ